MHVYVYNMHNMVEKHLNISIAAVRSRGASLVIIIKIGKITIALLVTNIYLYEYA
jgi:hypothetical protein